MPVLGEGSGVSKYVFREEMRINLRTGCWILEGTKKHGGHPVTFTGFTLPRADSWGWLKSQTGD